MKECTVEGCKEKARFFMNNGESGIKSYCKKHYLELKNGDK